MTKEQIKKLDELIEAIVVQGLYREQYTQKVKGLFVWNKTNLARHIGTSRTSIMRYFKAQGISDRVFDLPSKADIKWANECLKRIAKATKADIKSVPQSAQKPQTPKILKSEAKSIQKAKKEVQNTQKEAQSGIKKEVRENPKSAVKKVDSSEGVSEIVKIKNTCFTRYTEQGEQIKQIKGDMERFSNVLSRLVIEKEELEERVQAEAKELEELKKGFDIGYKRLFSWLIALSVAYIIIISILGLGG